GLELIKGLKSQKNTEAIPIILYSGQLTADLKTHALQAGAIAVLEKPFPLQEFLDLVAQICEETMQ
ncbi:MAG: response regulator, partial [Nitrospirota bacterium]